MPPSEEEKQRATRYLEAKYKCHNCGNSQRYAVNFGYMPLVITSTKREPATIIRGSHLRGDGPTRILLRRLKLLYPCVSSFISAGSHCCTKLAVFSCSVSP